MYLVKLLYISDQIYNHIIHSHDISVGSFNYIKACDMNYMYSIVRICYYKYKFTL